MYGVKGMWHMQLSCVVDTGWVVNSTSLLVVLYCGKYNFQLYLFWSNIEKPAANMFISYVYLL